MTGCAPHREFLAAVADGETALVPPETLAHVAECSECAGEVRTHQLLSLRLRQAADQEQPTTSTRRSTVIRSGRARIIAATVACALALAGAGVGWYIVSRPDPVQAAVSASSRPLQIESDDPAQVGQWCLQASGRALPAIQLDGMRLVGARMDRAASTGIVTVVYSAPSGGLVAVSWLEGPAPSGSGVEDRKVSGRELLIVHSTVGTAVVTGSSADAMWLAAAAIESTAP